MGRSTRVHAARRSSRRTACSTCASFLTGASSASSRRLVPREGAGTWPIGSGSTAMILRGHLQLRQIKALARPPFYHPRTERVRVMALNKVRLAPDERPLKVIDNPPPKAPSLPSASPNAASAPSARTDTGLPAHDRGGGMARFLSVYEGCWQPLDPVLGHAPAAGRQHARARARRDAAASRLRL